jgi:hypothetical protein
MNALLESEAAHFSFGEKNVPMAIGTAGHFLPIGLAHPGGSSSSLIADGYSDV